MHVCTRVELARYVRRWVGTYSRGLKLKRSEDPVRRVKRCEVGMPASIYVRTCRRLLGGVLLFVFVFGRLARCGWFWLVGWLVVTAVSRVPTCASTSTHLRTHRLLLLLLRLRLRLGYLVEVAPVG